MPVVGSDVLRESFDPHLLLEDDRPKVSLPSPAKPSQPARPVLPEHAEVAELFADSDSQPRPRQAAESRQKPRVCPDCGGMIPVGMSLCQVCGYDYDSGGKVDLVDIVDEVPELLPPPGPPFMLLMLGVMTLMCAAAGFVISLIALDGVGRISVAALCLYGVFAAVQFLRGRSVHHLLTAVILGAVVDILGLIILPIFSEVMNATPVYEIRDGEEVPVFRPLADRIDFNKVTWGIIILIVASFVIFALLNSNIKAYFQPAQATDEVPDRYAY
jgi:hypothetical protein